MENVIFQKDWYMQQHLNKNVEKKIKQLQQQPKFHNYTISDHQIRLEKLTPNKWKEINTASPVTRKWLNWFKINKIEKRESFILKLLKYESPGVEEERWYLSQIITLTQIYCKIPVRKCSFREWIPLLASSRHCAISCTIACRRSILYHNDNIVLLDNCDEGLTEGRPPMAETFQLLSLNKVVLLNSGKIETTKYLSSSIVCLQRLEEKIITSSPLRKIIKKFNVVLGMQDVISLVKAGGSIPQGVSR